MARSNFFTEFYGQARTAVMGFASLKPSHTSCANPMSAENLDALITASARTLDLPVDPAWRPAIRFNLEVTFRFAALVAAFPLPDDAEPAPVFRA
jgi:hypothetical protein